MNVIDPVRKVGIQGEILYNSLKSGTRTIKDNTSKVVDIRAQVAQNSRQADGADIIAMAFQGRSITA